MSIHSLFNALKEVGMKVNRYKETYMANKHAVKESIVAPLIRSLGWDPSFPDKVLPMYKCILFGSHVYLDYALIVNGVVKAGIIVKELGSSLDIPLSNRSMVKPDTLETLIVTNLSLIHV